jgi:hypothetical protein
MYRSGGEEAQSDTQKSISPWSSLFVFFSVELCGIIRVKEGN